MSRTASITIELAAPDSPCQLIDTLLDAGWSYESYGGIRYLPLGDRGSFNWQIVPINSWPEVRGVLQSKERRRELVGLGLAWREVGVGATFHLRRNGRIMVVLDAGRPRLEGCGPVTDMSWYLQRIICPLVASGRKVRAIICSDHD